MLTIPATQTCEIPKVLTSFKNVHGRIGIFGGSFDPPHNSHLEVALKLKEKHRLDHVVFIPTAKNPLKANETIASGLQRLEMIELMIKNIPNFYVSPIEIVKRPPTYTIDTISEIEKDTSSDSKLFLMLGSDCLNTLHKWKNIDSLIEKVSFVIVNRSESIKPNLDYFNRNFASNLLENAMDNLTATSSTQVREQIGNGNYNLSEMDSNVTDYIKRQGLYKLPKETRKFSFSQLEFTNFDKEQYKILEPARRPHKDELQTINPAKIVIAFKKSRFGRDLSSLGLSEQELYKHYITKGEDAESLWKSHLRQESALNIIKAACPNAKYLDYENLDQINQIEAQLIVALGGDEHFKKVASLVKDQYIVGVNSDPASSNGALLGYTPETFVANLRHFIEGNFFIEEWARLSLNLNGKFKALATCEIFVGERERLVMSHHRLTIDKQTENQKGSGLLIVTGSGSTGWYDSAVRFLSENGIRFLKTIKQFAILLTEPAYGKFNWSKLKHVISNSSNKIKVESLNSNDGIVSCDSLDSLTFQFKRGDILEASIADSPLRVVRTISLN